MSSIPLAFLSGAAMAPAASALLEGLPIGRRRRSPSGGAGDSVGSSAQDPRAAGDGVPPGHRASPSAAVRLTGALAGACVGLLALRGHGPLPVAVAGAIGGIAPGLLHARRVTVERTSVANALPALSADVAAALAAGLAPVEALGHAARHRIDPASVDAVRACSRIAAGGRPSPALARLAAQHPDPHLRALVMALDSARTTGTPALPRVAQIAAAAADASRRQRSEAAARSGPLIQLTVALGLVPSVLLLIAAVVVSRIGH